MTQGFEHQNRSTWFAIPKAAPAPQHGQKTDKAAKPKEPRSFQPRPGH